MYKIQDVRWKMKYYIYFDQEKDYWVKVSHNIIHSASARGPRRKMTPGWPPRGAVGAVSTSRCVVPLLIADIHVCVVYGQRYRIYIFVYVAFFFSFFLCLTLMFICHPVSYTRCVHTLNAQALKSLQSLKCLAIKLSKISKVQVRMSFELDLTFFVLCIFLLDVRNHVFRSRRALSLRCSIQHPASNV